MEIIGNWSWLYFYKYDFISVSVKVVRNIKDIGRRNAEMIFKIDGRSLINVTYISL